MTITLLQFTDGDVRARIYGMGESQAFQAFRWVHYKGTDLDERRKMELRASTLNPARASTIEEVEKTVMDWGSNVNRLTMIDDRCLESQDLVQPYWSIMPEPVQDYLINRALLPDEWSSIDKIELAVEAFMRRWRQKTIETTKNKNMK